MCAELDTLCCVEVWTATTVNVSDFGASQFAKGGGNKARVWPVPAMNAAPSSPETVHV
jgi:hypothetical protein